MTSGTWLGRRGIRCYYDPIILNWKSASRSSSVEKEKAEWGKAEWVKVRVEAGQGRLDKVLWAIRRGIVTVEHCNGRKL